MKEKCENCRFSVAPHGGPYWTCHYDSPKVPPPWPETSPDEWCGKWESRCFGVPELRYHEPVGPYVHELGARKRGLEFIERVRLVVEGVINEYANPTRYAQGVAFHMLVMLAGEFESDWDEYRVQVKCGDTWENMEFNHHDL